MTAPRLRRRAGVVAAATAALMALWAGPAAADTSTASATAATLTLAGGSTASSGSFSATSDGATSSTSGNAQPALTVLGSQTLITSGVLVQKAVARTDGSSAACAGLVGSGGGISIGSDGSCTVTPGTGGVSIRLVGGATPVDVLADAITSRCTATSAGATTGGATLTNARVSTAVAVALPATPANGTSVSVSGVATLLLNGQTQPSGAGSIRVSALYVTLAGSTARVDVADSVCGLNVATLPVPALPLSGWTVAAGAVVAGWAVLAARFVRRRAGTVLVA
ncbi:choice-of-anchor P family protein [Klenkia brasiliensis]|uniref:Neocarzinostatin family protein n=1 Tax=Klenkia brasiliensis TaxID=333142 RepID=A0A1G7M2P0_9ACTN|nr:choice-of-anchor P family protein [Klenkia brasiliensis]SDF55894.1 hypothetical protein SAMN05660324_0476 [Klenkia brasiliensis]